MFWALGISPPPTLGWFNFDSNNYFANIRPLSLCLHSALCSHSHTQVIHLKQCLVHLWGDHLDKYIREAFNNIQMLHLPRPLDYFVMQKIESIHIHKYFFQRTYLGHFLVILLLPLIGYAKCLTFLKVSQTTCSKSTISTCGYNQISDNDVTIDA